MSEEYLAGVGLRVTQFESRTGVDGNALANLNTEEYPDGALAMVIENNSLYALDKASLVTPDGTSVIAAIGGGNWIMLTSIDNSVFSTQVRLVVATGMPNTGALTQNTWTALPSATSQYALGVSTSPLWTASTSSGILTYSGPARPFLIFGSITLSGAETLGFCFSHSASPIISTTTDSDFEERETAADETNIKFMGSAVIGPGHTIRGVIRSVDNTTSITVRRYQLTIIPAS